MLSTRLSPKPVVDPVLDDARPGVQRDAERGEHLAATAPGRDRLVVPEGLLEQDPDERVVGELVDRGPVGDHHRVVLHGLGGEQALVDRRDRGSRVP